MAILVLSILYRSCKALLWIITTFFSLYNMAVLLPEGLSIIPWPCALSIFWTPAIGSLVLIQRVFLTLKSALRLPSIFVLAPLEVITLWVSHYIAPFWAFITNYHGICTRIINVLIPFGGHLRATTWLLINWLLWFQRWSLHLFTIIPLWSWTSLWRQLVIYDFWTTHVFPCLGSGISRVIRLLLALLVSHLLLQMAHIRQAH